MQFSKLFFAAVMPFLAAANTHTSCICNSNANSCITAACNDYSSKGVFFNKPKNAQAVFSQMKDGRCYAVYNDGSNFYSFEGLGGNEWLAVCEANCKSGSSC